ncbi:ATP-binding protein [Rhodoferax sp.]|uniref:ATP-binding protein n=1 Tax=Rhodoferax sp. TaxID=50421 RepID=UPI00260A3903|nr:ATP-binding protein [Rhodoferax sp.]MDD5479124.1 ATP-binding protein [Rhodoferax sp.]
MTIQRAALPSFCARLQEPRRFLQVLAGPRQVGKTTLVRQALSTLNQQPGPAMAQHSVSADNPGLVGGAWLRTQWETARALAAQAGRCVLVLDEVQKLPGWTEEVKRLWDEDTLAGRDVRVVVLGSAPLLIARGLTESMAGRFELTRMGHWTFAEMHAAFGLTLDEFIYYGGYPGAASLVGEPARWAAYVRDALIETTISKDVLLMSPVQKPALLRRVFDLACRYSGQELSYQKMLGQLLDAGNTTTLAHYLELLEGAGMVCGLQKYSGQVVRQRGSSPKLQVFNTALMGVNAMLEGFDLNRLRATPELWGRITESAVGAELLARHLAHSSTQPQIYYWRDGVNEVDYVLRQRGELFAFEVKSGVSQGNVKGLDAFCKLNPTARPLILGTGGLPLQNWFAAA